MQREGFGAVGEWDGTHTWGVEDFEQVHAGCDHANSLGSYFRDPEGEASPEEEDGQKRKGEEQKVTPAKGVDREEGWNGEDPV